MSQWLFSFTGIFKHLDSLENYINKCAAEYIRNGLMLKVCLFCIAIPFLALANDCCYYFSQNHLIIWWRGKKNGKKDRSRKHQAEQVPLERQNNAFGRSWLLPGAVALRWYHLAVRGCTMPLPHCMFCLWQRSGNPDITLRRGGQRTRKVLVSESPLSPTRCGFPAPLKAEEANIVPWTPYLPSVSSLVSLSVCTVLKIKKKK